MSEGMAIGILVTALVILVLCGTAVLLTYLGRW